MRPQKMYQFNYDILTGVKKKPKEKDKRCSCCDMELDGWIYYEKGNIKLCHFCYNGLVPKEDE